MLKNSKSKNLKQGLSFLPTIKYTYMTYSETDLQLFQLYIKNALVRLNSFLINSDINTTKNDKFVKISIVSLPKKRKIVTLLRSPHVHKRSKQQFSRTFHKFSIFIKFSASLNRDEINAVKELINPLEYNLPGAVRLTKSYQNWSII